VDAGAFHHTVFALGGGHLFGLHKHAETSAAAFDPRSAGLDHVAFSCGDRAELEKWGSRLDELGVVHGGIVDAPYGSGLSFRDPNRRSLMGSTAGCRRPVLPLASATTAVIGLSADGRRDGAC
jgi:hypothetical protein